MLLKEISCVHSDSYLVSFVIVFLQSVWSNGTFQAEKEPILSSFLYASILSHDCLERALGFVLANRLQSPTLLATQLMDIFCNIIMDDRNIQRSIRLDVQVICLPCTKLCLFYSAPILMLLVNSLSMSKFPLQAFKDRDPSCLSYCSALLYLKVLSFSFSFLPSCSMDQNELMFHSHYLVKESGFTHNLLLSIPSSLHISM